MRGAHNHTEILGMKKLRIVAVLGMCFASGCDFKVTNPGPIQTQDLNDPAALPAMMNGAGRLLSDALNWIAYTGGAVSREIFPAGSTGSFGISVLQQNGKLVAEETDPHWNRAQRARFVAEEGLRRAKAQLSPTDYGKSKTVAQLLLWAGYANRLLGENMCDAVIDAGPKQPYTAFLMRAEAHFTEAIAVATAAGDVPMTRAATAARAAVRADLGNWTGAVADAGAIPDAFRYQMPYYNNEESQYNRVYFASANRPYRAHTAYRTYYDNYFRTYRADSSRISWDTVAVNGKAQVGDAAISVDGINGRVPWYFQRKYRDVTSAITLSSGWEMRLIEAEAALRNADTARAMPLINKHRIALGVAAWPAPATLDEAWQRLKRERGIEMWLEARRLGDIRRWAAASTPGPLEDNVAGHDVCFPIPLGELQTNPALP